MDDNRKFAGLGLFALKSPTILMASVVVVIVFVIVFFLVMMSSFLGVAGFEVEGSEKGAGQACVYMFEEKEYVKTLKETYGVPKKTAKLLLDVAMKEKVDASVLFAMLKVEGKKIDKDNLEKYGELIHTKYISQFVFSPYEIFEDSAPTVTTSSENEKGEKVEQSSKDQAYISEATEVVNTLSETMVCNEDPNNIEEGMNQPVYGDGVFSPPLLGGVKLNSPYGYRIHPITGASNYHRGADIACRMGEPILSILPGKIHTSKYHNSWGNYVLVDHENGLYTLSAHMSALAVKPGQRVTAGTTLGACGSTGDSTGPHLHLELQLGKPYGTLTDPMTYFKF